jgi:hypothetical protein
MATTDRQRKAFKRWSSETARQQRGQTAGVSTTQKSVTKYGEVVMSSQNLGDLIAKLLKDHELHIVVSLAPRPQQKTHTEKCEYCGWTVAHTNPQSAKRALTSHYNHCPEYARYTGLIDNLTDDK